MLFVVNLKKQQNTSQCVVTLYCTALPLLSPPPSPLHPQQTGNLGSNVSNYFTVSTLVICHAFRQVIRYHLLSLPVEDKRIWSMCAMVTRCKMYL